MGGRDRIQGRDAQAEKVADQRRVFLAVNLVDGKQDRLAAAPQQVYGLGIGRVEALTAVEQKDQRVRFVNRQPGLVLNAADDSCGFRRVDPAGIDQDKLSPAPRRADKVPIPGHPWGGMHHGFAIMA